jgi:hypothetical protein
MFTGPDIDILRGHVLRHRYEHLNVGFIRNHNMGIHTWASFATQIYVYISDSMFGRAEIGFLASQECGFKTHLFGVSFVIGYRVIVYLDDVFVWPFD